MAEECNTIKQNLGLSKCKNLPTQPKIMFTTPRNFTFTEAQLTDSTFWQEAIKAGRASRVYLWPDFDMFENISEETQYEDTSLSYLVARQGNYRFKFSIHQSMCLHRAMFSHASNNDRVVIVDQKNQALVTKLGTDSYAGLSLQLLNPEKLMINDGSVTSKSPILVALRDHLEVDENGYTFSMPFINSLERLTDVDIAVVGTPNATTIVVTVKASCDGTTIEGLVLADFVKLATGGAVETIDSVVYADGQYTLTGLAFTTGTVNLVASDELSLDAYESTGAATVTIA